MEKSDDLTIDQQIIDAVTKFEESQGQISHDQLKATLQGIVDKGVNTPHFDDFNESLKHEMAHHRERWGEESDKVPHHFSMVISYINGKLTDAIWSKDSKKFEHHLITLAAVAGTAHKYFKLDNSDVQDWFPPHNGEPLTHLRCNICMADVQIAVRPNGPHHSATCTKCGSFIKHLDYSEKKRLGITKEKLEEA